MGGSSCVRESNFSVRWEAIDLRIRYTKDVLQEAFSSPEQCQSKRYTGLLQPLILVTAPLNVHQSPGSPVGRSRPAIQLSDSTHCNTFFTIPSFFQTRYTAHFYGLWYDEIAPTHFIRINSPKFTTPKIFIDCDRV